MWNGCLSFSHYLPLKSSQFGLKTFEICKSLSDYLRSFIFHTGKETILDSRHIPPKITPKATEIIIKLSAAPQRLYLVDGKLL
jgi:hypothetical protein